MSPSFDARVTRRSQDQGGELTLRCKLAAFAIPLPAFLLALTAAGAAAEVHITSRSSGKVVAGAQPTISATDRAVENAMTIKVPVAVMEGVGAGSADLHYGNNVELVAGHVYRVTVTLNREGALFAVKSP